MFPYLATTTKPPSQPALPYFTALLYFHPNLLHERHHHHLYDASTYHHHLPLSLSHFTMHGLQPSHYFSLATATFSYCLLPLSRQNNHAIMPAMHTSHPFPQRHHSSSPTHLQAPPKLTLPYHRNLTAASGASPSKPTSSSPHETL